MMDNLNKYICVSCYFEWVSEFDNDAEEPCPECEALETVYLLRDIPELPCDME